MDGRVHQICGIRGDQLASVPGLRDESVIFADLQSLERMRALPFLAVAERGSERVMALSLVQPPSLAIRESHRVIAGDLLFRIREAQDLIDETASGGMVVIVPVADDLTTSLLTPKVALFSDRFAVRQMNQPDVRRVWQKVADVLPVR